MVQNTQNTPSALNTPVVPAEAGQQPPKKKGHKALWSAVIIAFVLALIIVMLGIYYSQKTQQENELRAYENAMMSTEPAVLQNFLDVYIEAPVAHRDSIKVHLMALKKIYRIGTMPVPVCQNPPFSSSSTAILTMCMCVRPGR